VTVKKRQTIMANPLDEIELTVRPAQRKAKKASTTPSKKIEKSAPISVRRPRKASSASLKLSSAIADEDISSVKENSAESKVDYSKNKSSSLHEFHSLSAEEIFMEESGSRDLVMIKPLSSDLRLMRANKCVLLWSSVSVPISLIPFVVLDVAATIAIQVKMIKDICDLYNIPFKNENARAFISGLVGGGVATIASSGLKNVLLKSMPHIGSTVAFLAQPALGFSTTYALGQVFIKHLEEDGALTDFDSEKMREVFRDQLERGKSLFKRGRPS